MSKGEQTNIQIELELQKKMHFKFLNLIIKSLNKSTEHGARSSVVNVAELRHRRMRDRIPPLDKISKKFSVLRSSSAMRVE
jgi:hypothetical protein